MGKYVENNLNKNEQIILKAELNPIRLVLSWVGGILFFWLIVPLFSAIKNTILHVNTELAITNKRIIGKVGFANSSSLDAPLNKIQNVSAATTLFGKIFNYGVITITTAAGQFRFAGIKKVDALKGVVMNQIDQYEEDRIKQQAAEMANAMAGALNNKQ